MNLTRTLFFGLKDKAGFFLINLHIALEVRLQTRIQNGQRIVPDDACVAYETLDIRNSNQVEVFAFQYHFEGRQVFCLTECF